MISLHIVRGFAVFTAIVGTAAACTPPRAGPTPAPAPRAPQPLPYRPLSEGLPPIPEVTAPLAIDVVHPGQGDPRPAVDSTFVYGSVGTGGAALVINGVQVPVAPNGAFIAYLPLPVDGTWRLEAFRGEERAEASVSYRAPGSAARDSVAAAAAALPEGAFPGPRAAVIVGGADTLATGSDAVRGLATAGGTTRWFFPRGARVQLVERRGGEYRVRLDTASAWIDTSAVRLETGPAPPVAVDMTTATLAPSADGAELRIAAGFAPFQVRVDSATVDVTVYRAGPARITPRLNDFVTGGGMEAAGPGATRATATLSRIPWGYQAFYEPGGTLVVRIRRPPPIDAAAPLRGIRIVVDPGHPPAGATGPTRLREADANLQIALRLAEKLRAAGAEVLMTRTADVPVELGERTRMAVAANAHLLVSVHNNAFGEGQNPFRLHHTSTYYFHPFSAELARALNQEIAAVVKIPNRGALFNSLALVRPTWMPTALTESLFMPIPEQEAALRDPQLVDQLAAAHARGIEAFLRARANR
ncbi:MAG TPA: N-acetylmuramoyl-L-alanine amidase [Longimicrobium sp.]